MKRFKKVSLIVVGCLVPIICVAWFYRYNLHCYHFLYKMNNFNKGDKLYAWDWTVKTRLSTGAYDFKLYQYAVPLNTDKGNKPIMVESEWNISADSLFKYKTGWIGKYTGWLVEDSDYKIPLPFYSITTNKKALVKVGAPGDSRGLPPGYAWGDGPFYVIAWEVNPNEITDFPKIQTVSDLDEKKPAAN